MDAELLRREVDVFHPLNPHPTTWEAVRPILVDVLSSFTGKRLVTVSPDVWLAKVRQEMESAAGSHQALEDGAIEGFLRVNPAVKLLGFYEEMMPGTKASAEQGNKVLEMKVTERSSAKMYALQDIKAD